MRDIRRLKAPVETGLRAAGADPYSPILKAVFPDRKRIIPDPRSARSAPLGA